MAMSASIGRLSGLPEEVIGHILSFLPSTKSLVQTSILAKQWRFLWTDRVPSLRFFTVNEDSKSTGDEFSSWIDQTTTISARNLVIRLNYQLTLPRSLFTINTLVDLCIVDSGDIRAEGFAYNFPALKKLRLVNVGFDSDDSLAHLISGCPVLEELTIDGMMLNYSCDPSVLRVNRIMGARKLLNMLNDKPALRYLRLRTACEIPWIWTCSHHRLHSLIEADLDLSEVDRGFLHNMRDVKRLTLSIRGKEIPARINLSLIQPVFFRNLTELNLRGDWYLITVFLACAVNLRVLTIHSMVGHNTRCWIEPQNYISLWTNYTSEWLARTSKLRSTLMDHLETVNLFDFEWSTKHEFEMVKYILGKAKVLKTMELIYTAPQSLESDWTRKVVEAHNTLASFEMQSSTCSIRLSLC